MSDTIDMEARANQAVERFQARQPPAIAQPSEDQALLTTISRIASDPTADIEKLTKVMDLYERIKASRERKSFDAAIAEAKAEISPVIRNKDGHNSKYADFAAIAKAVDPVLSKHGLSYRFRTVQAERICVTCVLRHRDGHFEETTLSGPADTSGNKNPIQAIGSTLTYLQRYSLVQALGLAADNDDDGKAAGTGGVITDAQADEINALLIKTKSDIGKFLGFYDVPSVSDLPAPKYKDAIGRIRTKLNKESRND